MTTSMTMGFRAPHGELVEGAVCKISSVDVMGDRLAVRNAWL